MSYEFYALLGRMRYITRWGLMRNTFSENIQEHSHQVAVLAHALALIRRDILGLPGADPDKCAVAALYHDASEILTGDLPTPIKYYNPDIKKAYKQVERIAGERLLKMLPQELVDCYTPLVLEEEEPEEEEKEDIHRELLEQLYDMAEEHPKNMLKAAKRVQNYLEK